MSDELAKDKLADLYLLGAGILFPDHLTIQTIEILAACNRVYTNLGEERLQALPKELRMKCVSLRSLYQDKRKRSENYRDVIGAVLEAARQHRPCAWMTPGHPFVFDSVSQELLKKGRALGWNVEVIPAVSSLDTLLAQLGYDPCNGLVVYEATSLVREGLPLLPHFATFLFQPAVFDSDLAHLSADDSGPNLNTLRDHLLQFYPSHHECAVVYSADAGGQRARIVWKKLRDLGSIPYASLAGSTLFVPPTSRMRAFASGQASQTAS